MWNNYIKIAWRNFRNGRLYSLINVLGLSIGAAVCLLILVYVTNEWSYDRFHAKAGRTYRMWQKEHYRGEVFFNTVTPILMGPELKDHFPEVEQMTRFVSLNNLIRRGNILDQEQVQFVDPEFLKVFDFRLIRGNRTTVLKEPDGVVLTEAMALKYFSDPAPVGQTLSLQVGSVWKDFKVTGILEKTPGNSSLQYNILAPFEVYKSQVSERAQHCWTCVFVETYAVLRDGTDGVAMQVKAAPFFDKQVSEDYKPGEYEVGFQALPDIHLDKAMPAGIAPVADARYPYILSAVALLILLLAAINFVTLAVGRSLTRAREVGVRKATGATRRQLMAQFWVEAVLTAVLSVGIGVALAKATLPWFNDLTGLSLVLPLRPSTLGMALSLALVTGLIAGLYPAIILSGFSPVNTLRGLISGVGQKKHTVLRSLIGVQFLLSVLFIISTLVMQQQIHYLQHKNLGFRREGTLIVPFSSQKGMVEAINDSRKMARLLEAELKTNPSVKAVATSNHTFGAVGWSNVGYTDQRTQKYRTFFLNGVDENFIPAMGIELREGQNFTPDQGDAGKSVIVNEQFAAAFGLAHAVGTYLPEPFQAYRIIGVAKDFHFASLHEKIQPLMLAFDPVGIVRLASDQSSVDSPTPKCMFKISGGNIPATVAAVQQAWKSLMPEQAFQVSFMEDDLNKLYRSEMQLSSLVRIGTWLAILIACLGLLGMSTLTIARRTKEIGIRKVLGASSESIVGLLTGEFIGLAATGLLLAIPIAWWAMTHWLEAFAYRIDLGWRVFAVAGFLALLVAFLTLSIQSIRAALADPARSLRSD